jgi:DNA-binding XRE family transcriptional regulator
MPIIGVAHEAMDLKALAVPFACPMRRSAESCHGHSRKTAQASWPGQRLAEERKQRGLTQAQLAETMGVTPGRVSQIERGELSTIEAIARYVQALGGHLELVANFADHTLTVTTTEAA